MAHSHDDSHLSKEERTFRDYMQHGDDFFKIEIFRSARSWYNKALEMNMEKERVKERISECERLLRYERKVFSILGIVTAVILVSCFLLCMK